MTQDNDFQGLDFNPKLTDIKKPISITIGFEAQELLRILHERYSANVSKFIDGLLRMVYKQKQLAPVDYAYRGGQYKEITLLLRAEVVDFLNAWILYGKCGSLSIGNTQISPSTPLQIGEKLSYIIANDPDTMRCDSTIYGETEHMLESKFRRVGDKAKQTPEN